MMANFILKTLFIYSTVFASNIDEEDQIFTYFIKAFDDENNIQNWVKARNKGNLHALNLFKKIISKVRDVLLLIYIDERDDIKTLIFETNMDIKKIGDQYFEAINIISSLKRIIIINDEYSGSNFQSHNVSNFFLNVLYNEYENIYYDIKWMLMIVGVRYNTMETLCLNPRWLSSNEFQSFESEVINRNILITENIFNLSNEMIDSIIPTIDSKATYVEANFFGFINSKKCCGDGMNSFTLEKSTKIYTEKMLQFTLKCSTEQCIYNKIDMKKYMDIGFICNRTTAKLLITLFHFYSEIREYNTTYEIFLQENGDYLIYWSLSDTQPKEEIKTYWQQKEIIEFIDTKIIHKFGLIIDYDTEYSTKKSDETENEPISTKLILMSCGHQLGFELIDEFLEYFHTGTTSSKCHICRIPIWIVGSYDTVVYKCK